MNVIAIIGSGRGSGKTTTVESMVMELTRRGKRVGTIKQIHEDNFTLDTEEKDTWKHANAGARIVVTAAPHEVAAMKRIETEDRFDEAVNLLSGEELDYVIVEGNLRREMPIIFAAGKMGKAETTQKILKDVKGELICISTFALEKFDKFEFPVLHPKKDAKKMADLVEKFF